MRSQLTICYGESSLGIGNLRVTDYANDVSVLKVGKEAKTPSSHGRGNFAYLTYLLYSFAIPP
jgi:hypothetical protein